ncbi:hypothetical protein C6P40_000185 [Pichia californica]|uniref:Protein BIG1 n=1 Tax=Pichia californica TaxID=460514 RepID=A0A9P6WKZ5_9ASCO|nr:hypothetical protein C6P42_005031 [[Candida] californica]KAG0689046.1 hypothetical protein C6P40_000185 [[Candida] californica]
MKFTSTGSTFSVSALIGLASAFSFENTAPLLISSSLLGNHDYSSRIDTFDNANNKIKELTGSACAETPELSLTYIRVHGLDESESSNLLDKYTLTKFIHNVVYESENDFEQYPINEKCSLYSVTDSKDLDSDSENKWGEYFKNLDTKLNVIELYKESSLDTKYLDDINEILITLNTDFMIIQGLPDFKIPSDSILKQASLKLNNLINSKNNNKREDINYDEIEKELQESFDEINELLDDSFVEAYDDDSEIADQLQSQPSSSSKKDHLVEGSLFDKYSFFSTGIWMGTIVLLFLTWLLSIALGWLNSMKISYGAFDKPFDFEKKLQ